MTCAIRRVMNIVARARDARSFLALLPFVLIALLYVVGSAERRAANPDDKLLPPFSRDGGDHATRMAFEPDRRTGEIRAVDRHGGEPPAAPHSASRVATLIGLVLGLSLGLAAAGRRDARHADRRPLDDPADGDAADPVHRLRPRRPVQGRAHRLRRRALPRPRPRVDGRRACRASSSSRRRRSAPRPGRSRSASCCRRSCRA